MSHLIWSRKHRLDAEQSPILFTVNLLSLGWRLAAIDAYITQKLNCLYPIHGLSWLQRDSNVLPCLSKFNSGFPSTPRRSLRLLAVIVLMSRSPEFSGCFHRRSSPKTSFLTTPVQDKWDDFSLPPGLWTVKVLFPSTSHSSGRYFQALGA